MAAAIRTFNPVKALDHEREKQRQDPTDGAGVWVGVQADTTSLARGLHEATTEGADHSRLLGPRMPLHAVASIRTRLTVESNVSRGPFYLGALPIAGATTLLFLAVLAVLLRRRRDNVLFLPFTFDALAFVWGDVLPVRRRVGELFRLAVRLTAEALAAGRLLDIDALDYLVIARDGYVSLRDRGVSFDRAACNHTGWPKDSS